MTRRIHRPAEHEGMTTLMTALSNGSLSLAKEMILVGEDLQVRDKHGRSVLYHAFAGSEMTKDVLSLFQLLGQQGVDFNSTMDMDCCTALITAIALDWPGIVQLMVDRGADVEDEGMPKFGASVSTDTSLMSNGDGDGNEDQAEPQRRVHDRFIFSKGCSQYVTPLLCAIMLQRHSIVHILMSAGANCQQTSLGSFWRSSTIGACSSCDVRVSPLHLAAYGGQVSLLGTMLERSRAQCIKDNSDTSKAIAESSSPEEDVTPLWLALLRGEMEAIKLLLEFDFPKAPPCHFGSGLYITLEEGRYDIARMLLLAGYDLWEDLEWIESELYPTSNTDFIDFIKDFVHQPRSLLVCSRDALRKHMGPRMPAYLACVKVPRRVSDILQLKDVLSTD